MNRNDKLNREVRLTNEHIDSGHPEMEGHSDRILETFNDTVMEKIDENGNIIGFSTLKVGALRGKSLLPLLWLAKLRSKVASINARLRSHRKGEVGIIPPVREHSA
ncbi:MAG: hypothetical protein ACREOO_28605 [bacterium]